LGCGTAACPNVSHGGRGPDRGQLAHENTANVGSHRTSFGFAARSGNVLVETHPFSRMEGMMYTFAGASVRKAFKPAMAPLCGFDRNTRLHNRRNTQSKEPPK
jgi:hypothetical protein